MTRLAASLVITYLCVAMVTGVDVNNRASKVCNDWTGFNCLFQSNRKELSDVPIHFDRTLPNWLTGTLVRNGVGLFESGSQSVTHAFDGFAKLSSWKFFPNSTAVFSTRFVASDYYKTSIREERISQYLLFSPPKPEFGIIDKVLSLMSGIDNMNVNVFNVSGNTESFKLGLFTDAWNAYEVSIKDLSTLHSIQPKVPWKTFVVQSALLSCAHPMQEPGTTNGLNFLAYMNTLSLVRMTSLSGRELIAEWDIGGTVPYMHSFSVTQTKAILLAGPYICDVACLLLSTSPMLCIKWYKDKDTYLYIADLKTGTKRTIVIKKALFVLHHINAYDVNKNNIVMDVVAYDNPHKLNEMLMLDTARNATKRSQAFDAPVNKRIHINLKTGYVTIVDFSTPGAVPDSLDMPCINELHRYKFYCYVYGAAFFVDGKHFSSLALLKKNVCKGGKVEGSLSLPYHYPSEPFFVANPKGETEDDGVLLVPFLRGKDAVTYLAVINATTMTILSKADAPTYVPLSLHGRFFNEV